MARIKGDIKAYGSKLIELDFNYFLPPSYLLSPELKVVRNISLRIWKRAWSPALPSKVISAATTVQEVH